ncbi:MAG: hypothetical protein Q9218_004209 [Villophora microphyllina]
MTSSDDTTSWLLGLSPSIFNYDEPVTAMSHMHYNTFNRQLSTPNSLRIDTLDAATCTAVAESDINTLGRLQKLPAELRDEIYKLLLPYHQAEATSPKWVGTFKHERQNHCMHYYNDEHGDGARMIWGRNTTVFLTNRKMYKESAATYYGTTCQTIQVSTGLLAFAGHRLDPTMMTFEDLPISASLMKHLQIEIEPFNLLNVGDSTSEELLKANPVWYEFRASIELCAKIILANKEYLRSLKIRIPGCCDMCFESWDKAAVFWMDLLKPLETLQFNGVIRFTTICWKGPPIPEELDGVGAGQCAHKGCRLIVRALHEWKEEVDMNPVEGADEVVKQTGSGLSDSGEADTPQWGGLAQNYHKGCLESI